MSTLLLENTVIIDLKKLETENVHQDMLLNLLDDDWWELNPHLLQLNKNVTSFFDEGELNFIRDKLQKNGQKLKDALLANIKNASSDYNEKYGSCCFFLPSFLRKHGGKKSFKICNKWMELSQRKTQLSLKKLVNEIEADLQSSGKRNGSLAVRFFDKLCFNQQKLSPFFTKIVHYFNPNVGLESELESSQKKITLTNTLAQLKNLSIVEDIIPQDTIKISEEKESKLKIQSFKRLCQVILEEFLKKEDNSKKKRKVTKAQSSFLDSLKQLLNELRENSLNWLQSFWTILSENLSQEKCKDIVKELLNPSCYCERNLSLKKGIQWLQDEIRDVIKKEKMSLNDKKMMINRNQVIDNHPFYYMDTVYVGGIEGMVLEKSEADSLGYKDVSQGIMSVIPCPTNELGWKDKQTDLLARNQTTYEFLNVNRLNQALICMRNKVSECYSNKDMGASINMDNKFTYGM